ncbi:MAG: alpha/beta hydrolase [Myxococcota bacterium]
MPTALESFRAAPLQFVDLPSVRMAYRSFGSGPALVLVHGWPLSGETYRDLVEQLSDDFTCIVPDLPGAGHTPWDDTIEESFTGYADRLVAFIEALGLQSFGVLGHDSGGAVARLVAARMPQRVYGVALTNTEVPGHVPTVVRALQIAAKLPGARWMFRRLVHSRAYLRSKFGFAGCFKDLDVIHGSFDDTAVAALRRDTGPAITVLRNANLSIPEQLDDVHAQIDAPMIAVWGDEDPFFPYGGAEAMAKQWPRDAVLHRMPGYRLLVHEEAASEVARLMRPFLSNAARDADSQRMSA